MGVVEPLSILFLLLFFVFVFISLLLFNIFPIFTFLTLYSPTIFGSLGVKKSGVNVHDLISIQIYEKT
jgi:hypothetical protein